jgi:type III secretion protein J
MNYRFRAWCLSVTCLASLSLLGCSQQLQGGLDESAANQIVGALRTEGIAADKVKAGDGVWRVDIPNDEFARSVQVMRKRNLPPQKFDGLGQVFKKDSLVSTPTEERARLIHAMSQELEKSLLEMDGVLVARVHPVIPPNDPLNPKKVASSAAVFVKYRPGSDMASREGMVRALVAAGIEGLAYDDVRVLMVGADPQSLIIEKPVISRVVPPVFWGILGVLLGLLILAYFVLNWRDKAAIGGDRLRGRMIRFQRNFKPETNVSEGP